MISENKDILKRILVLAIPSIIECILDTLVQYVDAAMVGQLGETATTAVSISTNITWLIGCPMYACAVAVVALISKAWGENNNTVINKVAALAVWSTIVVGLGEMIITLSISKYVPIWMGAEKSIHQLASTYFFIICLPMIFRAALTILAAGLRGLGDTKTPMLITLGMNILNLILDYCLIYAMEMGVTGAAVATAISFLFGGVVMSVFFARKMKLPISGCFANPGKDIIRSSLCIALPSAATSIISCTGYVVFAALVSGMGTVTFAAHSLAITAEGLFYTAGHGIHTAVATLSGYSLGKQDRRLFSKTIRISSIMMIGIMSFNGVVLYLLAYPLMGIFTSSSQVQLLGSQMLKLVAFSEPFFGLTMVYKGAFGGLGMTKEPLYVEFFGMWAVRILFTYICVKIWKMPLIAVWVCMISDNIIKCLLLMTRFYYLKVKNRLVQ